MVIMASIQLQVLNPYGFDQNGNHYLTGGPYDPKGFDTNGNHEETGGPYDENGCNINGYHHEN